MSRSPQSRNRSDSSLARHHGRRRRGISVLFGCEGETEIEYLRAYCRTLGIHGEFPKATTGLDPLKLVERTMLSYDEDFDLVVCVFDRDTHASFDAAKIEITRLANLKRGKVPIIAAYSVVCFELWILLHLEQTDRPFNSAAEIISYIRQNHIVDYNKAKAIELVPHIKTAYDNAIWLHERHQNNGNTGSVTKLHKAVEELEILAGLRER